MSFVPTPDRRTAPVPDPVTVVVVDDERPLHALPAARRLRGPCRLRRAGGPRGDRTGRPGRRRAGSDAPRRRRPRGGADDYVTTPFSPNELVARIQTMPRRPRRPAVARTDTARRTFGDQTIDPERVWGSAAYRDEHVVAFLVAPPILTDAACGGLKPLPAGRLRRAIPPSPAQHHVQHHDPLHRATSCVHGTPSTAARSATALRASTSSSGVGRVPSRRGLRSASRALPVSGRTVDVRQWRAATGGRWRPCPSST